MFDFFRKIWKKIAGDNILQKGTSGSAKTAGNNAGKTQGRHTAADKRNYAGRLPVCVGCLYSGSCGGFFPGCGCYGSGYNKKEVSVPEIHRGNNCTSTEFAAWCAFMGYPVAERYWAEYEEAWDYYESVIKELSLEDGEMYNIYAHDCRDYHARDTFAYLDAEDNVDDELFSCDDYDEMMDDDGSAMENAAMNGIDDISGRYSMYDDDDGFDGYDDDYYNRD